VNVSGLSSGVAAISTGDNHSCVLTTAGGVKCWGDNSAGQLGNNSTTNSSAPVDVNGLGSGIAAIGSGGNHTCALTTAGGVKCWGNNATGQLGNNSTANSSIPVDVSGLSSGVSAISLGGSNTCALIIPGSVQCWGDNFHGQLGDNSIVNSSIPMDVKGLNDRVQAISAGDQHVCLLTTTGGVQCWGWNASGQLGNNSSTDSLIPVGVSGLSSGVLAISAGGEHTCALITTGNVQCWGNNQYGQLGNNSTGNTTLPTAVSGLSTGTGAIRAGLRYSCALTTSGGVKCWGDNEYGQLGNNSTTNSSVPIDVSGLSSGVMALSVGYYHTCAVSTTGSVKCWGRNDVGQLGNGGNTDSSIPVDVSGLGSAVSAISIGRLHTCALTTVGGVKCWGDNSVGQLGNSSGASSNTPLDVSGLNSGITAISAGYQHTCALTAAGAVKCWGSNSSGQLGNNSTNNSNTPVDVSGLSNGVAVLSAGRIYTCAVIALAGVKCWGDNRYGQLGNNSTTNSKTPVDVSGLSNGVNTISAGGYHACALTAAGNIKCWGRNDYGQLGNGNMVNSSVPVDVSGLADSSVSAISAGGGFFGSHTCALMTTGGIQCWGSNGAGQLGDGNAWRTTPVDVLEPNAPTPTATSTATTTPSATNNTTPAPTTTPTATPTQPVVETPTAIPTPTNTPTVDNIPKPLYLALVTYANTLTPTPTTPSQPTWQRVGQGGIVFTSFALQGTQLFAGARDANGGLYARTLANCATGSDFGRVGTVNAKTLLGVAFQGTRGAAAAFDAQVFYSSDGGSIWTKTQSAMSNPRTVVIASNGTTVYAGTEGNGIYRSEDGGVTWEQRRTDPQAINRIRLDTQDANSLWVATEKSGVWVLTIGINRLVQKKEGLSAAGLAVWDFAFDRSGTIYLATFDGIYKGDGVNPWQPFGLQNQEMLSLTIKDGQLYAGGRNQGSGVWRLALSGGDWARVTSAGWQDTYTVRDLLYADDCQGLLAATDDGVWVYR
jgi:alpha-tubulin suppressor-like RCC1 family protein